MQRIVAHLLSCLPNEGCGVLIGERLDAYAIAHEALPARNLQPAPNRFTLAPDDIVRADRAAAARSWDIVGFYHSHPNHAALPSELDRAGAWRDTSFMIVSLRDHALCEARSWRLGEHEFAEENIVIESH